MRIESDLKKVRRLQESHGGWIDSMKAVSCVDINNEAYNELDLI